MNVGQGDYECIPYYRPHCRTRRKTSPSTIPMSKVHEKEECCNKGSWWGHIQRCIVGMRRAIELYSPKTRWVTDWYLAPSKAEKHRLEALSKMIVSSLPPKKSSQNRVKIITEMSASRWHHISQQWYTVVDVEAPICTWRLLGISHGLHPASVLVRPATCPRRRRRYML